MLNSIADNILEDNDKFIFADENENELVFANENNDELLLTNKDNEQNQNSWKILIVDDENEIHNVTKLALDDFVFEDKKLKFISAYSGKQAIQIIQENPDIAIILLDVIMEHEKAGLELVKYVRESLKNQLLQIVLRTGEPGQVPEKKIIQEYDINDYKTKTELTSTRLFTTVRTNLKTFSFLKKMSETNQTLQAEIIYRQQVESELLISEAKERSKSQQLEKILQQLQQTQFQLIQNEKMSAIGQLVAGVAHEINNPLGFIRGNIHPALEYIKDLFSLFDLYQTEYPNPSKKIQDEIEAIELEYLRQDLPKLIYSMREGIQRIYSISNSLRTFSRGDIDHKISFNIHDGLDSTILLLKHRLKASELHPQIKVNKNYGDIPNIQCFPGQLNQVFMNLIANAIDALEESNQGLSYEKIRDNSNNINISTKWQEDKKSVIINIKDNGIGIPQEVKQRIFDNYFTTKAVGKGTGLGLSITKQIITQKHGGTIEINSEVGRYTEFIITIPA